MKTSVQTGCVVSHGHTRKLRNHCSYLFQNFFNNSNGRENPTHRLSGALESLLLSGGVRVGGVTLTNGDAGGKNLKVAEKSSDLSGPFHL